MSRPASDALESVIRASIAEEMARVAPRLAKLIADAAAARVGGDLTRMTRNGAARPGRRPRPPRVELTRWTADARARRVPTFVIDATGLDTKKRIVAKYGPATFEKGKPPPPALDEKKDGKASVKRRTEGRKTPEKQTAPGSDKRASPSDARAVVARPPIVRKRSATA